MEIQKLMQKALPKMDIRKLSDPYSILTHEECEIAIKNEIAFRAARYNVPPESIHLSDDAIRKTLTFANDAKISQQKTSEYWKSIEAEKPIVKLDVPTLKSNFISIASHYCKNEFFIDDHNKRILDKLFLYFSASPDAANQNIDLSKGILLMGGLGTGKSTIMRSFASNQHASFKFTSCILVSYEFAEHGFKIIKDYNKIETIARNRFGQRERGICFDDLGTENERKRFGDAVNVMADIILNRYDSVPFNMTHITTNLNAEDIEHFYGKRVRSRMREMFNILAFNNASPDRRK